MTLEQARNTVIECNVAIKALWPDAFAMFICTEGGHFQFAVLRPKHFPLFTCDVPASEQDWEAAFCDGAYSMKLAIEEIAKKHAAESASEQKVAAL